ncbi:MAG: hypothetical protein L6R40_000982 [Gallowayella cf. fulva]|nr:MAG: hypothetical protein L6R40_000982 [Xanthomendoza cf. fulva]
MAGEELINVPLSALVGVETVPQTFRKQQKQITVQGLLASYLASTDIIDTTYAPWASTWPTPTDFRESLPICWSQIGMTALTEELLDDHNNLDLPFPPAIERQANRDSDPKLHPSGTLGLLQEQKRKLRTDWRMIKETLPKTSFEKYVHFWFIVNTRTFYFENPNVKTHPPRHDCIVMCPFIDLFNHDDTGCNVQYGLDGYSVTSDKAYRRLDAGDELFVSYGQHTNDFLLVEYGFVLGSNRWDSTPVDHLLMPYLVSTPAEEKLRRAGYLGNYTLDPNGVCYRTEVAVRTQILSDDEWSDLVAGRDLERPEDEINAQALIANQILDPFLQEAKNVLEWLRISSGLPDGPSQVLIRRWEQIQALLQQVATLATVRRRD